MSKKFNIKNLIKVSAVALALIGGGAMMANTIGNNNAHADDIVDGFDYTAADKGSAKVTAKNDKLDDAFEAKLKAEDEPDRKADALSDMEQGGDLNPNLVHDPVVRDYLESKGYSAKQIQDSMDTPEKDEQEEASTDKYIADSYKDALKYADSTKASGKPVTKQMLDKIAKHNARANHHTKRNHSSRSAVRKPKITADAQAIKNDQKQLSTRRARKALNNYKRNHKSNRYVKHLIQTNKDLTKHQKNLARTKSNRKAKTKRNAHRRSLKRVRKNNRKNKNAKRTRRNHKRITKRNRNRKHMKRNARKHTRRNLRHRK